MPCPGSWRRGVVVLATALAVLALSGCIKAEQAVTVRSDGSGSVVLHVEVDKRAIESVTRNVTVLGAPGGAASGGLIEPFTPVDRTFPDGTRVRASDGPDRSVLDASFDFAGPDEYRQKLQQVSQAISTNPDAALSDDGSIKIRRTGDRMEVALDFGTAGAAIGDLDLAALAGVLAPDALPEVVVTVTMPGPILSTNGSPQGRTVRWDLLQRGSPTTLMASSRVAEPGLPAWAVPAGAALVVALLLAIGGVLLSQRRRPGGDDPPADHDFEEATFFPPMPTPTPTAAPGAPAAPEVPGWPTAPPAAPVPAPTGGPLPPAWPVAPAAEASPWRVPGPPAAWPVAPAAEAPPWRVPGPPATEPVAAPPPALAPEPGWYADPAGGTGLRWWDGARWTGHTT